MSDSPLVSIIMAARDTEPYLPACLDSILKQTYKNWQLIAVNDHSTDQTEEILRAYGAKDERIKVFNGSGHRLIPTLQEAYAYSNGELINRMDSDDMMPLDKLEVLVQTWLNYGKGTIIAGGTQHFVDDGEVGGGFIRYEEWLNDVARNNRHYQEIYTECVIPSHCWIIHREDFDKVGAFNPVVYPEDYDLCFRFYKQKLKVVGIDKILHFWRDRSARISRTWEEYKDNRYFDLKLQYFYEIDRDRNRPLALWGAGRNGKDMAKLLLNYEQDFHWYSDNPKKTGKDIYGIRLQQDSEIPMLRTAQIMVVVASPDEKVKIKKRLTDWGKKPVDDFWFFL